MLQGVRGNAVIPSFRRAAARLSHQHPYLFNNARGQLRNGFSTTATSGLRPCSTAAARLAQPSCLLRLRISCTESLRSRPGGILPYTLPSRSFKPRLLSSTAVSREDSPQKLPVKPFYITTPIFYVNAEPHVGHLYSMVIADVLKRYQQLKGNTAILCTGTDEHGMKVQRAAERARTDPKTFCDKGAEVFKQLAAEAGISNDHFVRTSEKEHKEAVQYAWTLLEERGYIYLDKHEGWYCVSDETFYPASAVQLTIDPPTGRKMMSSIETGKEVEWTSETNYRFKLSAFKNQLLSFYKRNPTFITPRRRMQAIVNEVEKQLEDLSVSRPSKRLTWGVPVPKDDSQTIYVWLDALLNYLTKAGYPFTPGREREGGWPADIHIIGKDITRFHCIYWPAFLMALDLPLPKQVLTHAHWTLGHEKMSKSTGNVVNPFFALNRFGAEAMRFYLASEGGIDHDSDYGNENIIAKYKKALQGGIGNLSSRITRGKGWEVREAVKHGFNAAKIGGPTAHERLDEAGAGLENADAGLREASASARSAGTKPVGSRSHKHLNPPPSEAPSPDLIIPESTFTTHGSLLSQTPTIYTTKMDNTDISGAIAAVMHLIYKTNAFIQTTQPWVYATVLKARRSGTEIRDANLSTHPSRSTRMRGALLNAGADPRTKWPSRDPAINPNAVHAANPTKAQDPGEDVLSTPELEQTLHRIIFQSSEALRLGGILLLPVMPGKMGRLLDMLGVKVERRSLQWARFGVDREYGDSVVELGRGTVGVLFEGLQCES